MKNRRLIVIAFICLALLVASIGYAAVSGHLTIDGSATFNKDAAEDAFTENLVFSNAQVTQSGSAETATLVDEATASEQTATFTVRTLAVQDETAIFTYTLTNNNLVDAAVTISATHEDTTANPSHYFSVYNMKYIKVEGTDFIANNAAQTSANVIIPAGDSVTVTLCVELTTTPSTDVAPEHFSVHLTATSVDE